MASLKMIQIQNDLFNFDTIQAECIESTRTKTFAKPLITYKRGVFVFAKNGVNQTYNVKGVVACQIKSIYAVNMGDYQEYYAIALSNSTKKDCLIKLGEGKNNWI